MKGSSRTLTRMLRRVVLLLLVALIMSPVQSSRQLGNEHPQTGRRDGDPQVVVVNRSFGRGPPTPNSSDFRIPNSEPVSPP